MTILAIMMRAANIFGWRLTYFIERHIQPCAIVSRLDLIDTLHGHRSFEPTGLLPWRVRNCAFAASKQFFGTNHPHLLRSDVA